MTSIQHHGARQVKLQLQVFLVCSRSTPLALNLTQAMSAGQPVFAYFRCKSSYIGSIEFPDCPPNTILAGHSAIQPLKNKVVVRSGLYLRSFQFRSYYEEKRRIYHIL